MNRPGFVSYQPLFSMNLPVGQLIHQLLRSFLFTVWLINQAAIEMGSRDADRLKAALSVTSFPSQSILGEPSQDQCKLD